MLKYNMLGETEKSSDVCRTASLSVSEMGHEQRAATSSTVTDQRRKKCAYRVLALCTVRTGLGNFDVQQ